MPPPPFVFQFDVAGEQQILRGFSRFAGAFSDLRPAWDAILPLYRDAEQAQFSGTGIGPAGTWKPLSARYQARKSRLWPGQPIMVASGRLRASLTGKTGDTIEEIAKMDFRFGTKVPYAIFHQSRSGRSRLPRRPVIDIPDNVKREMVRKVQGHLVKEAGRSLRLGSL